MSDGRLAGDEAVVVVVHRLLLLASSGECKAGADSVRLKMACRRKRRPRGPFMRVTTDLGDNTAALLG